MSFLISKSSLHQLNTMFEAYQLILLAVKVSVELMELRRELMV
jgi:hypothetical protein